jgi:TPR repeat protein
VPQDFAEAARLYRLAAERDYGGAQNNLALLYARGQGVPRDPVEAAKWFALAERHGDTNGADVRAAILRELTPEQRAEVEKRVREFTPAP